MKVEEFDDFVRERWTRGKRRRSRLRQLTVTGLGLGGESGEVLEHVKKFIRDGKKVPKAAFKKELGDVIHYATRLGQLHDITLAQILRGNISKLKHRDKHGKRGRGK